MELDDSIGLAAEAGVDYDITDRWSLNASVWYMNLDTTAKIDTSAGAKIEVDVDIDPVAYVVGLSYKL
jgi:outer membrane protein